MEYIYVMYSKDKCLYKIGRSKNPFDRMLQLSREYSADINIVLNMAVEDSQGTETYLLEKFKNFCVAGEWFNFKDSSFIKEVFGACFSNLKDDGFYISPTHIAAKDDSEVSSFVNSHYIVSVNYAYDKFNIKYPGTATVPMKLKNLGCVKINHKGVSHYVTPMGQAIGLHLSTHLKERSLWVDKEIIQF